MSLVHWLADRPVLRRPVLLVALEGFVDAGAVAATAAMFLRHRWQSEVVARFDRDALLDYRARRPTAVIDSGRVRRVEWPDIEVCAAHLDGERDALLLLGPEPDMRWEAFAADVAELALATGVESMVGLGAYPAAVPHTRPTSILQAGNALAGDVAPKVPMVAGYTGPVNVGVVLQSILERHGVPATGLWAEVPHYIAGSPDPVAALAMVSRVAELIGTTVDTTELEAAATLHRRQVDDAVAEHGDAADMVTALERHVDSGDDDDDLPSGEDLAKEIERFLRTQQDG
ncbi:filament polymerization regulator ParJ [soil metagenome]|jgi:proteasome assembly chaperone (PAC2) family protein